MKPMRLRAVMREAGRNIASGTSRLALAVMISAICSIVCMGADLAQITGLVNASQRWRSSGSSIYEITLQGGIDGASCEGLNSANGVIGAAALRQSTERTYVASLPATGIPTYEASAHIARVFGASTESSGVIMATALAHTYGARAGTVLPLVGGERMRVAATFAWPSDGRRSTYGYAVIEPGNDTKPYDTCLVRAWPVPRDIDNLLRVAVDSASVSDASDTDDAVDAGSGDRSSGGQRAQIGRINTTLGTDAPEPSDFDNRITGYAPIVMLAIAVMVGFVLIRMRRIEIASALHAGCPRSAVLLQLLVEASAAIAGACVICLPVAALATLVLPDADDAVPVIGALCRVPCAMTVGMLVGTTLGALLVRERQLFVYFKSRA